MKDIAVTYLGGSGFLVALGDIGLLFDASEIGPDFRILPEKETLAAFRKLYVFVSHRHSDHFSESIYDLCGETAAESLLAQITGAPTAQALLDTLSSPRFSHLRPLAAALVECS